MTTLDRLNLTADNPREQILQIRSYLFQVIEQLEMALDGIDENSLSAPFLERISGIEQDIAAIRNEMETRQQALVVYINRQIAASNSDTTTEEE